MSALDDLDGCSPERARELTDRIKTAVEATWHLIVEAYQSGAHRALGYSSWDDYCTREFGTSRLRLPREERQEVVASLRESGLSIRAIAAATGTGVATVDRALRSGVPNGTPEPDEATPSAGDLRPPGPAPEVEDAEVVEPAPPTPIVGTDGKTYQPAKPEPTKPRRSSLPDTASRAGWEFRRSVERLERIADDDRFPDHREQVAAHIRGHLTYATEVLHDLLVALDTDPQEDR